MHMSMQKFIEFKMISLITEIQLEPTDNKYRGTGDLPYLNGQMRFAFVRGNEILDKPGGITLDGSILTGVCVISGGDTYRESARKSVSIKHLNPKSNEYQN